MATMPEDKNTSLSGSSVTPTKMRPVMVLVLVLVVVAGLGAGYYLYRTLQPKNTSNTNTTAVNTNVTTNTNSASNGNMNVGTTNTNSSTTPLPTGGDEVTWIAPKKIADAKLLGTVNGLDTISSPPVYYQIGTLTAGSYKSQKLVMVHYFGDGIQRYPTVEYYAVTGKTGTLLAKPSSVSVVNAYYTFDDLIKSYKDRGLTVDTETTLAGLFAPDVLYGPKPHQKLVRDTSVVGLFDSSDLTVAFTDPVYGKVYTNTTSSTTSENSQLLSQTSITHRYGFYIKMADGMIAVYQHVFDFITYDSTVGYGSYGGGVLQATWTSGSNNTQNYYTALRTGCGSSNYTDVVSSSEVSMTRDLVEVGTTSSGDTIYGYKDANAKALKDWYNDTYQIFDGSPKVKYADFVADHPIVFVVDPFGRLARMTNGKYQTQAECGKPVIYLYPTSTMAVDVKLQPQGGFTYTEPVYNNGWQVTAKPNGELTERATGTTYPYLFWEGRGGIYSSPDKGTVVAQADVHHYLVTTLAQLGLNQKETADFIEFWEPKMQGSPYYFVSFLGNQTMNAIAPLSVTPRPDTVIRILMDYHPLAHPIVAQAQHYTTPKRTGFTVVEWGGVLR